MSTPSLSAVETAENIRLLIGGWRNPSDAHTALEICLQTFADAEVSRRTKELAAKDAVLEQRTAEAGLAVKTAENLQAQLAAVTAERDQAIASLAARNLLKKGIE